MNALRNIFTPLLFLAALSLAGCEKLGFEDPAKVAAAADSEGKAVGASCRNAGRGLEDCYQRNPKALKAAVFSGWKEMNDYMTQNKIEVIPPPPPPPPPPPKAEEPPADAPAAKGEGKDGKDDAADGKAPAKKGAKHT
ncbi:MAG: hypothetical protein PHU46_13005 [Rhodocyclaceae bacterium]|nr:hypothetical protein [Rhodocyclaceae bacterium]